MAGDREATVCWPQGGEEMAACIRMRDWAATPLGPMEGWPAALRAVVDLLLPAGFPMVALWGPDLIQIYNDGYRGLMDGRHPSGLGQPTRECWPEVWHINAPIYERVWQGETVTRTDALYPLRRHGRLEEVWLSLSYSPLRDDEGGIAGVLVTLVDTTVRTLEAKRHLEVQRRLRATENRFQAFVTATSDVIYQMSSDWTEMAELDGRGVLADARAPMTSWAETYLEPEDRASIRSAVDAAIRARRPFDLEHRVRRADGTLGWVHSRAVPILDEAGAVIEWFGAAQDVTHRVRAEERSRESDRRYRELFNAIDQGFCVIELILDGGGHPVDYRFLEVNSAFERQTGLQAAVGQTMRSLSPDHEEHWFDTYGRIDRTRRPERFEAAAEQLGRYYEVYAFPVGRAEDHQIGILFNDIRERRRSEAALRASEERQSFLLRLSDAMRVQGDALGVLTVSSRLLRERLGASRVTYWEVADDGVAAVVLAEDAAAGLPPFLGRCFHTADYEPDAPGLFRAGRPVTRPDIAALGITPEQKEAFASTGTQAYILMPLLRSGHLVALLVANHAEPHEWAPQEIALIEDVAARTWDVVERACAEATRRETEGRLHAFGEASSDLLWIRDAATLRWTYVSPAVERVFGLDRAGALAGDSLRTWLDLIIPEDRERVRACLDRVRGGERLSFEFRIRRSPDGPLRTLRNSDFPIRDDAGEVVGIAGVTQDVTQDRAHRAALVASERRLRALIDGLPQLVWRAAADGQWTWASPQWRERTGQAAAESQGWGWLRALHPDDRAEVLEAWDVAEGAGAFQADYRVCDAGEGDWRWYQARAAPVHDAEGRLVEWLGTSTDVQEMRRLQEHLGGLIGDLQQQTENLLGVVRMLGTRRGHAEDEPQEPALLVRERLSALMRPEAPLARLLAGPGVAFEELLRAVLDTVGEGTDRAERVILRGTRGVTLRASTAQILALALHELAVDAREHGALGGADGQLSIRWMLIKEQEHHLLHVEWRERGGRRAPSAARRAGGLPVTERILPDQLGGFTAVQVEPDGLHCTITLPVEGQAV